MTQVVRLAISVDGPMSTPGNALVAAPGDERDGGRDFRVFFDQARCLRVRHGKMHRAPKLKSALLLRPDPEKDA